MDCPLSDTDRDILHRIGALPADRCATLPRLPRRNTLLVLFSLMLLYGPFAAEGAEFSGQGVQRRLTVETRFPAPAATSPSFVVRTYRGGPTAASILTECRRLKQEFHETWFSETETDHWDPRCEVVLHGTRSSYAAAVGRGGVMSRGSSIVEFRGHRLVRRRIDLLVDDQLQAPALRHELMHVVLAEQFQRSPPRWIDEGLATLADSADKQRRHRGDLDNALQSETVLPVVELLALDRVRSSEELAIFYGQSLSLVRFLVQRRGREEFIRFVHAAIDRGYDRALRDTYRIDGVAQLDRLWRRHLVVDEDATRLLTIDEGAVGP